MRLKDKTALITGGGRGIGATTALMMLSEGAKVGVADINEDSIKTLKVNLIGVFLCSQVVAKYMLAQKSGKIINISSIRGIDHCGREGVMDYSASKGAVINLTKTMAKELAPHINVNTVAPGHTLTEMTQPLPEEVKKNMIEGAYLKRMAQPEEIAQAILFLASEDSNFFTGQLLLADGGFRLK